MSFQNTKINPRRFHPSQIKFYLILLPLTIVMSVPVLFVLLCGTALAMLIWKRKEENKAEETDEEETEDFAE